MLAKQYRLTKKEDWKNVFKNGSFLREGLVAAKVVKSGLEETRIGFLARVKGTRQAVLRNKIKRRLRAAVSLLLGNSEKGFDAIVRADERVLKLKFDELRAEVNELFKKARIVLRQ